MSGARGHSLTCSMFQPTDKVNCRECLVEYEAKDMPKTKTGFRFVCSKCKSGNSLSRYHHKKNFYKIGQDETILAIQKITDRPEIIKCAAEDDILASPTGLVASINKHSVLKPSDWDYFTTGSKGIRGYYVFRLMYVHRLVAGAFLGDSSQFVNHIDSNKLNNNLENLEYVSNRENSVHSVMNRPLKKSYRHNTGSGRVWYSRISNNGQDEYLGSYLTKEEAEAAYDKRFMEIHQGSYYDSKTGEAAS